MSIWLSHESLYGPCKLKRKILDLNKKNDECRNIYPVMINAKIYKLCIYLCLISPALGAFGPVTK